MCTHTCFSKQIGGYNWQYTFINRYYKVRLLLFFNINVLYIEEGQRKNKKNCNLRFAYILLH